MDITAPFTAIVNFFNTAITWLQTHYIILGSSRISFFVLSVALLIIDIIITSFVAWSGGVDDDD